MAMFEAVIRPVSRRTSTFLSEGPLGIASVGALVATLLATIASRNPDMDAAVIFSGIFDIMTVFSGFLATFYVYVAARQNRFLERIQHSQTFRSVKGLLRFTLLWSGMMILVTYVIMIVNPTAIATYSVTQLVVWLWFVNLFLIAVNFVRCVKQFNIILTAAE